MATLAGDGRHDWIWRAPLPGGGTARASPGRPASPDAARAVALQRAVGNRRAASLLQRQSGPAGSPGRTPAGRTVRIIIPAIGDVQVLPLQGAGGATRLTTTHERIFMLAARQRAAGDPDAHIVPGDSVDAVARAIARLPTAGAARVQVETIGHAGSNAFVCLRNDGTNNCTADGMLYASAVGEFLTRAGLRRPGLEVGLTFSGCNTDHVFIEQLHRSMSRAQIPYTMRGYTHGYNPSYTADPRGRRPVVTEPPADTGASWRPGQAAPTPWGNATRVESDRRAVGAALGGL